MSLAVGLRKHNKGYYPIYHGNQAGAGRTGGGEEMVEAIKENKRNSRNQGGEGNGPDV